MLREAYAGGLVSVGYDLMGFVNNEEFDARYEDGPEIAHQRVSLLDRSDKHHRTVGRQPGIRDAPVGATIQTRNQALSTKLRGQFRLDLVRQRARGNDIKRQRSDRCGLRTQEQFFDDRHVGHQRLA
jgi:hypothetical protein